MAAGLKWFGPQVVKRVERAALKGVNKTMAQAVIQAKLNHPGWQNVTGKAEGSINIISQAKNIGKAIEGMWGSRGVSYMLWLEINHGGALRASATMVYPNLKGNIKAAF